MDIETDGMSWKLATSTDVETLNMWVQQPSGRQVPHMPRLRNIAGVIFDIAKMLYVVRAHSFMIRPKYQIQLKRSDEFALDPSPTHSKFCQCSNIAKIIQYKT